MRLKSSLLWPALVLGIGLALLSFMVVVESEPGALPLALVLIGLCWTAVAFHRTRARRE